MDVTRGYGKNPLLNIRYEALKHATGFYSVNVRLSNWCRIACRMGYFPNYFLYAKEMKGILQIKRTIIRGFVKTLH